MRTSVVGIYVYIHVYRESRSFPSPFFHAPPPSTNIKMKVLKVLKDGGTTTGSVPGLSAKTRPQGLKTLKH